MKGKVFNAQEVQAIIAGNKTQFREVKVQPNSDRNRTPAGFIFTGIWGDGAKENSRKCPYEVGQKIFCKEKFTIVEVEEDFLPDKEVIVYKATIENLSWFKNDPDWFENWKPAQHMKQEHSRITLQIKEIRVERLADISKEDIIKEGFEYDDRGYFSDRLGRKHIPAQNAFEEFWNATHKKPEEKFEASPWCWIVSFEVINRILNKE